MATSSDKKYGLFIPKSEKKEKAKITNVFGDDDDDQDEAPNQGKINSKYGTTSGTKFVMKKQTQLDIDKALAEDPTVFDYDGVYDDMMGKKDEGKTKKKVIDRKPRYIGQLLKASEKRQKEDERRNERKIQKEREEEGDEFADKEVFITSAYKKKMEERQEEEEREKREAALEAKLDVKNQRDMSGFYRYILNETTKDKNKTESDEEREGDSKKTDSKHDVKTALGSTDKEKSKDNGNNSVDDKKHPQSNNKSDNSDETESRSQELVQSIKIDTTQLDQDADMTPSESSESSESEAEMSDKVKKKRKQSRKRLDTDSEAESDSSRKRKRTKNSKSNDRESGRGMTEKVNDKNLSDDVQGPEKVDRMETNNDKENIGSKNAKKTAVTKPKWAKHTTEEDLKEAKIRYLARKLARERQRSVAQ